MSTEPPTGVDRRITAADLRTDAHETRQAVLTDWRTLGRAIMAEAWRRTTNELASRRPASPAPPQPERP